MARLLPCLSLLCMLVSSFATHALQPLEDHELSGVTGRDGMVLGVSLEMNTDFVWEDTDGTGVPPGQFAGMLYSPDLQVDGLITVTIDAGSSAGNQANSGVLSLKAEIPRVTLNNFSLYVLDSGAPAGDRNAVAGLARTAASALHMDINGGSASPVMTINRIDMGDVTLVMQMGAEAANFVTVSQGSTLTVDMDTVAVNDINGGGSLNASRVTVSNLDITGTKIGITESGMLIYLPPGATAMDIAMSDVAFDTDVVGDVYTNLLASVDPVIIEISGK